MVKSYSIPRLRTHCVIRVPPLTLASWPPEGTANNCGRLANLSGLCVGASPLRLRWGCPAGPGSMIKLSSLYERTRRRVRLFLLRFMTQFFQGKLAGLLVNHFTVCSALRDQDNIEQRQYFATPFHSAYYLLNAQNSYKPSRC